jgi:hypothetical protein
MLLHWTYIFNCLYWNCVPCLKFENYLEAWICKPYLAWAHYALCDPRSRSWARAHDFWMCERERNDRRAHALILRSWVLSFIIIFSESGLFFSLQTKEILKGALRFTGRGSIPKTAATMWILSKYSFNLSPSPWKYQWKRASNKQQYYLMNN